MLMVYKQHLQEIFFMTVRILYFCLGWVEILMTPLCTKSFEVALNAIQFLLNAIQFLVWYKTFVLAQNILEL